MNLEAGWTLLDIVGKVRLGSFRKVTLFTKNCYKDLDLAKNQNCQLSCPGLYNQILINQNLPQDMIFKKS